MQTRSSKLPIGHCGVVVVVIGVVVVGVVVIVVVVVVSI